MSSRSLRAALPDLFESVEDEPEVSEVEALAGPLDLRSRVLSALGALGALYPEVPLGALVALVLERQGQEVGEASDEALLEALEWALVQSS